MLILEKTASTSRQKTPYLEYESLIIENLSDTSVNVEASFLDLGGQMVSDGAVVDTLEAYGFLEYSRVVTRKKRFWGLVSEVVFEIGFVTFWTDSGTADLRFKAFNGAAQKARQWTRLSGDRDLGGEDNTEVSTGELTYQLKKTITVYGVSSSAPLYSLVATLKTTAAGGVSWLKLTAAVDGGSEEEVAEVSSESVSEYEAVGESFTLPISGAAVVLRAYTKRSVTGVAYNEVLKLYKELWQVVEYA